MPGKEGKGASKTKGGKGRKKKDIFHSAGRFFKPGENSQAKRKKSGGGGILLKKGRKLPKKS